MADGDINLNTDQNILLGIAAFSFIMFIIFIEEDDELSSICCCTTILLLIGIPFAATKNPTNTSPNQLGLDNLLGTSSTNMAVTTSERKRKNKNVMKHKKDTFPKEWLDLKEIYPEAEIDEYADYDNFSNGNWDMDGLREDLKIMIERTGKEPSKKKSTDKKTDADLDFEEMEHEEFKKTILAMNNTKLRKILKSRGLPVTGVKSKLIARLVDSVKEQKEAKQKEDEESTEETKTKRKATKKVVKRTRKKKVAKPKEEKTTEIECPDCSATMEIPDIPGMQEVECPECGIKGEIEL